jgi:hypothetical protein
VLMSCHIAGSSLIAATCALRNANGLVSAVRRKPNPPCETWFRELN